MNSCLRGQIFKNYRSESTSSVIVLSCRLMRMYVTTYFEIAIRHKKGENPPNFRDRVVSANFEFEVEPLSPLQYFCCSDGYFCNSEHSGKKGATRTPQKSLRKKGMGRLFHNTMSLKAPELRHTGQYLESYLKTYMLEDSVNRRRRSLWLVGDFPRIGWKFLQS